jgi:hypothetical protein
MDEEPREDQLLLAALDAGTASERAKPGVWERIEAKARLALKRSLPDKHKRTR